VADNDVAYAKPRELYRKSDSAIAVIKSGMVASDDAEALNRAMAGASLLSER
jgi:hypothetical protein